jgi:type VI secretion system protein ImpH
MASPIRRTDPPVAEDLFAHPYRYDFFQAIRILQRIGPQRATVGGGSRPSEEVVRFHALPSLSFPPSAIQRLDAGPPDAPTDMTVAFFGLIGPTGVLPHVYTELVMDRLRNGDRTLAAFLDIFQHRMLSFFYRAWEKHRPAIVHERGARDDPLTELIFSLVGLGAPSLRGRMSVPDRALLPYAGILAQRHRPAGSLASLLSDYFAKPFRVESFVGRWLRLEPDDRSRLGRLGPYNQLGSSLVVGARVWDEQSKFRIRVGPLCLADYRAFLPGQPAFESLCELARFFVDGEYEFDVQLVLKADEAPPPLLSGADGDGLQLGRTAWVRARDFTRDPDEAVFLAGA